jgi:hypothetical protein
MSYTCVNRRRHHAANTIPDHHSKTTRLLCPASGRCFLSATPHRSVCSSFFWCCGRSLPMPKGHVPVLHSRSHFDNYFLRTPTRLTGGRWQRAGWNSVDHSPVLVILRFLDGQICNNQHRHNFIGNHVLAKLG